MHTPCPEISRNFNW